MRFTTRTLLLPLAVGLSHHALGAQAAPAPSSTASAMDAAPVSIRWNRLVPRVLEDATAARRAARRAAAGDSIALRRIAQTPLPFLFRVYSLLSVAQYAALNAARDVRDASADAAIASASAAVLADQYTDSTVRASIARELVRDLARARTGSRAAERVSAGKRLGEDIANRVIAWAPAVNLAEAWNGTIPKGPGMWYSARGLPPIGIALASARGWLLDSASRFRPAPPPTYGSPEFQAALDEVRRVARERTREQTTIAQRWNIADPWSPWNETAVKALLKHHASDAEAVRVLAVLNVASSDAMIACFDAKYHYWSIRPSQADTTLVLADSVSLPNFPSYPSGHACGAGAFGAVLEHYFPDDRAEFTQIAEEQAMSRLYGGIHYRFDNDTGLALGRAVARYAIEREQRGGLKLWRNGGVARSP